MSVAILGMRGSYSEMAAYKFFGASVILHRCRDFAEIATALERDTEYAVVPAGNSITGAIFSTSCILSDPSLETIGELLVKIDHVLAGTADSNVAEIERIFTHAEAIRQCSKFLAAFDATRLIEAADTASAVSEVITNGDKRTVAICSEEAAGIYGAKILKRGIADRVDNATTFRIVRKSQKTG